MYCLWLCGLLLIVCRKRRGPSSDLGVWVGLCGYEDGWSGQFVPGSVSAVWTGNGGCCYWSVCVVFRRLSTVFSCCCPVGFAGFCALVIRCLPLPLLTWSVPTCRCWCPSTKLLVCIDQYWQQLAAGYHVGLHILSIWELFAHPLCKISLSKREKPQYLSDVPNFQRIKSCQKTLRMTVNLILNFFHISRLSLTSPLPFELAFRPYFQAAGTVVGGYFQWYYVNLYISLDYLCSFCEIQCQ